MSIDYEAMLYGPNYRFHGVDAELTPQLTHIAVTVRAIDKTAGVLVDAASERGHARSLQSIQIQTVRPCVDIRMSELIANGVALDALKDSTIKLYPGTTNEKTWIVKTHLLKPGPYGENAGEVRLVLIEEAP